MAQWTLDDIDWQRFQPELADRETIEVIKAASLVEFNGHDYARYLHDVFPDDAQIQAAVDRWAAEEVQHGRALARWATMADPTWDFEAASQRFCEGFKIPGANGGSVRGSRTGELVARCIVESGTSSLYTAIADSTDEPVLKQVCRKIAADEYRHYKLFYDYSRGYVAREGVSRLRRLIVALGRVGETEDDELAFAFHCANTVPGTPYDHRQAKARSVMRIYGCYRRGHVSRAVAMILKAVGLAPQGAVNRLATAGLYAVMQRRVRRFRRIYA